MNKINPNTEIRRKAAFDMIVDQAKLARYGELQNIFEDVAAIVGLKPATVIKYYYEQKKSLTNQSE